MAAYGWRGAECSRFLVMTVCRELGLLQTRHMACVSREAQAADLCEGSRLMGARRAPRTEAKSTCLDDQKQLTTTSV